MNAALKEFANILFQDKTVRVWDVEHADEIPVVKERMRLEGLYI